MKRETASNPYGVQVGQIWQDNDPRHQEGAWGPRFLKVFHVDEESGTAECYCCQRDGTLTSTDAKRQSNGKPRKIRLDRFKPTSTGYRRVTNEG